MHQRGVTESPGLFLIGLPWQHTRGSALLGFVKEDAEYLAAQIEAFSDQRGGRPAGKAASKSDPGTTPTRGGITPHLVR
jgi:putative flavoprotein involved in K+ transport